MQVESTSKPMFTVNEANEDTISAFEETDAAVDLRIKNCVCLVIDLEGFFVQKKFQVREMGYYSWDEHFDRHAFFQPAAFKNLSHKDKKTVNFAKKNIHGLTFQHLPPPTFVTYLSQLNSLLTLPNPNFFLVPSVVAETALLAPTFLTASLHILSFPPVKRVP